MLHTEINEIFENEKENELLEHIDLSQLIRNADTDESK